MEVRCKTAVAALLPHLRAGLIHPDGVVRLTMFTHDSPGLQQLHRQITEAVIMAIEKDHTITKRRKRVKAD